MTDIPDDIMETVNALYRQYDARPSDKIAAALMAERGRLATEMLQLKVNASNHAADAATVRHERDNFMAALTRIAKLDYTDANIAAVQAIRTALKALGEDSAS